MQCVVIVVCLRFTSHGYGFSLVCTLMCVSSLYLALKGVSFLGQSCNTAVSIVVTRSRFRVPTQSLPLMGSRKVSYLFTEA